MIEARITCTRIIHKEINTAFSAFNITTAFLAMRINFRTRSTGSIFLSNVITLDANIASFEIIFTGFAIRHPETANFILSLAWQKVRKTFGASVSVAKVDIY